MAYTTINKSTDYFNTKLYTGNGSTQHSITGVGFQPDLVWLKSRDDTYNHFLFDAVRGVGKQIYSNTNGTEATNMNNLYSFNADGFSLTQSSLDDVTNKNNSNFASWNWKANGAGSANTDGSINTTATSANTTAGFSIVKYTGTGANATVGHGLGAVPKMIIARNITDTEQWTTYHVGLDATAPEDYHVRLNTTGARADEAEVWNDTAPTSTVFSVGSSGAPNGSGDNHIAYCFAEKTGYSKFGSYTGNGNDDGVFCFTGFKPAFLLFKETSSGTNDSWFILDNKRNTYNGPRGINLRPQNTDAENVNNWMKIDFLSNGFKLRDDDASINESGKNYIYMAFGQSLVGTNNTPCTAR